MTVEGWEIVFKGERLEADLVAAVLASRGIKVEVFGDTAYSVAVNFTEARVFVPAESVKQAREVLREV